MTPRKHKNPHEIYRVCQVCGVRYRTSDEDPHNHCPKCDDSDCDACKEPNW